MLVTWNLLLVLLPGAGSKSGGFSPVFSAPNMLLKWSICCPKLCCIIHIMFHSMYLYTLSTSYWKRYCSEYVWTTSVRRTNSQSGQKCSKIFSTLLWMETDGKTHCSQSSPNIPISLPMPSDIIYIYTHTQTHTKREDNPIEILIWPISICRVISVYLNGDK